MLVTVADQLGELCIICYLGIV